MGSHQPLWCALLFKASAGFGWRCPQIDALGMVERFGVVPVARAATREEPATNLTDDTYFSDGLRLVVIISSDAIAYENIRGFAWGEPAPPVAEGQSDAGTDNVRALD